MRATLTRRQLHAVQMGVMVPRVLFLTPQSSAFGGLLLLPLAVMLGGAWFSPTACLLAIVAALERDDRAMLGWYALALGFDSQAFVAAPFFVALTIQRRVPVSEVGIAAFLALATLLTRAATVGFGVPTFPLDVALSTGAPNLWLLAAATPWIGELPMIGLAFTCAVGAAAAYVAWFSARSVADRALLDAALLCALFMAALVPGLDARAFMLATILALTLAFRDRDAARWRIAGLVGMGWVFALFALNPVGSLFTILATILQARAVLKPAANDNPLMARTI